MNPVERLRAAATLARKTAEAASPGPWQVDGPWWHNDDELGGHDVTVLISSGDERHAVAVMPPRDYNHQFDREATAQHIALWGPEVAPPVAAWLERTAERMDEWATKFSGALRYEDGRLTPSTYAGFFEAEDWQLALTTADVLLSGVGEKVET